MSKRSVVCVVRFIDAPPAAVWDVLSHHEGMPAWTPLRRVTLEPAGAEERNGVGAIRVLHAPLVPYRLREEITRFEPPVLLGYTLRQGLPTSDHHGLITLAPDGHGTILTWTIGFVSAVPGMGFIIKVLVLGTLQLMRRQVRKTSR